LLKLSGWEQGFQHYVTFRQTSRPTKSEDPTPSSLQILKKKKKIFLKLDGLNGLFIKVDGQVV